MTSGNSSPLVGSSHDFANPTTQLTVSQAYTLWAETYDNVANPMLALEERYLGPLLPSLVGQTILDLGCGTGRLLNLLSLATGCYLGVDLSSAMLARAARKLRVPGHLLRADCVKLPLRSQIADVVICSFLLGYVTTVQNLAAEIARVSRSAAELYVSEFHPDSRSLGWKRSFRCGGQVIELPTTQCSLRDIEHTFRLHGFDLVQMVEPSFDEPERKIFLANRKGDAFESSRGTPAIFIGHFRRGNRAA